MTSSAAVRDALTARAGYPDPAHPDGGRVIPVLRFEGEARAARQGWLTPLAREPHLLANDRCAHRPTSCILQGIQSESAARVGRFVRAGEATTVVRGPWSRRDKLQRATAQVQGVADRLNAEGSMPWAIGVDIGGTLHRLRGVDSEGLLHYAKTMSTPVPERALSCRRDRWSRTVSRANARDTVAIVQEPIRATTTIRGTSTGSSSTPWDAPRRASDRCSGSQDP